MDKKRNHCLGALILGLLLSFGAAPAMAEKPDHAGKGGGRHSEWQDERGKGGKGRSDRGDGHEPGERGGNRGHDPRDDGARDHRYEDRGPRGASRHFEAEMRLVVRDYYAAEFRAGHCPPGLAKKRNGCLPPGQARKWRMGHPLPRDLVYYDLPEALVLRLGRPPAAHRYVRVGADILLIAIGTSMVVDAIEDLGNM